MKVSEVIQTIGRARAYPLCMWISAWIAIFKYFNGWVSTTLVFLMLICSSLWGRYIFPEGLGEEDLL